MMEPTMVCELEAGKPNHQVLRFQIMAASNRAKTMAKPAPELTWRMSSTGSSVMTEKATAPEEVSTPGQIAEARPDHGDVGLKRMGIDDGRDRIGGVMETIHKLEAERDKQGYAQQQEGPDAADDDVA